MFVSFVTVRAHDLAKGLAGGRVRVPAGGDLVEAVRRRIAQDTRCDVVEIQRSGHDDRKEPPAVIHYELTLRGCLSRPGGARGTLHEGTIQVAVGLGVVPRVPTMPPAVPPPRRPWGDPPA